MHDLFIKGPGGRPRKSVPTPVKELITRHSYVFPTLSPRQETRNKPRACKKLYHPFVAALRPAAKLLTATVIVCLFIGCAATKKMPLREVDRPLTAPEGTNQIRIDYAPKKWRAGEVQTPGITWSYSPTSRLSFIRLPLPVIKYQFYGDNRNCGDTVKAGKLALAATAGVYSFFGYINSGVGLSGKTILAANRWLEFSSSAAIFNSSFASGDAFVFVGLQAGNKNAFILGCGVKGGDWYRNIDTFQGDKFLNFSLPLYWKVNFTPIQQLTVSWAPWFALIKTDKSIFSNSSLISYNFSW